MVSEVLPPLSEHQLLLLFAELFLLLFTARGLGEIAKRLSLPSVLGELLAGIVIGPSLLGVLAPGVFTAIFPPEASQYHLIEAVSWVGLLMLLVVTGLETDLELIISRAKPATYTAFTGIVIPFAMGFGLAYLLPGEFLAADNQRFVFSLFLGTALSISAIPVIAKVLIDMDVIGRDIGQITIASGMLNDTIGWILLALVASLARAGSDQALSTAGETILWLVIFLGVSFTLGRRLAEWSMRWVDTNFGSDDLAKTTAVMILALGVGTITQYLGLEAVLGAFVVGVLVGQVRRFDQAARHTFEVITIGIFAPIFFATAGLRVDLTAMADPTVLLGGVAILGVAIAGKFIGTYVGARAAGLSPWEGIAMGSGLNARGALEIIVATIGLSVGILTTTTYTIIVMVAIITSLLAPPLLRASLSRIELSEEEAMRLERKELERRSFLGDVIRVLLPTRCSTSSQLTAQLLGHIARERDIEVTNMYVDTAGTAQSRTSLIRRTKRAIARLRTIDGRAQSDGGMLAARNNRESAESCLEVIDSQLGLPQKYIRDIVRSARLSTSETVLAEAGEGYDLLALGASEQSATEDGPLFSLAIDDLIRRTPCPMMVVVSDMDPRPRPLPEVPIRRILLPTVGTQYSRRAAEIAFAIATSCNAVVEIVHVVNRPQINELYGRNVNLSKAIDLGEDIVAKEADLGRKMDVDVMTEVSAGEKPERNIVERAMIDDVDLIVIGGEIRPATRRAFFGHRVEHIVRKAHCPVAVISSASH
jgi:Kef-type K+ transport system membrane component KefB/nucleotide-binding universal stress UspA family protein